MAKLNNASNKVKHGEFIYTLHKNGTISAKQGQKHVANHYKSDAGYKELKDLIMQKTKSLKSN